MKKRLNQKAVYWLINGKDGYGAPDFGSDYPIEIDIRWTDKSLLVVTGRGTEETADAIIHSSIDLRREDYIMLGTLNDLDSSQSPASNGAWRIIATKKTYNVKANKYTFVAFLKVGGLVR